MGAVNQIKLTTPFPMKLYLFDLDGTLRQPKSGAKFINDPQDQQPIPGAIEAVKRASLQGICVGVTNQGGVAAGHKQLADAIQEQAISLELFPELLCIYFCPDFEGLHCWLVPRNAEAKPIHIAWGAQWAGEFRKPGAGMLKAAMVNHLGNDAQDKTWMIGDRPEDRDAAQAAGVRFTWASEFRKGSLSNEI